MKTQIIILALLVSMTTSQLKFDTPADQSNYVTCMANVFSPNHTGCPTFSNCSTNQAFNKYIGSFNNCSNSLPQWNDTTNHSHFANVNTLNKCTMNSQPVEALLRQCVTPCIEKCMVGLQMDMPNLEKELKAAAQELKKAFKKVAQKIDKKVAKHEPVKKQAVKDKPVQKKAPVVAVPAKPVKVNKKK